MDFDAGILKMHTFKKLPIQRPNINVIDSKAQYSCKTDLKGNNSKPFILATPCSFQKIIGIQIGKQRFKISAVA
ncbi:MAG: hypothetical protein NTU74_12490, partial [Deltaproteobacteria bacterium]|nr:hypothetical protein [Deltaproteobacteria bacterium]